MGKALMDRWWWGIPGRDNIVGKGSGVRGHVAHLRCHRGQPVRAAGPGVGRNRVVGPGGVPLSVLGEVGLWEDACREGGPPSGNFERRLQ